MTPRLAYSLAEAARLVGISPRSLRYLLQQGRLGFVRLGRRVLVRHEDLERLLKQGYCRATDQLDADQPIRPRKQDAPSGGNPEEALDVPCGGSPRNTAKEAQQRDL